MRGVVSFSLFGDEDLYTVGAVQQAILFNEYSRTGSVDWTLRYYVGRSVPERRLHELATLGAHLIPMYGYPEDFTATFWRFDVFKSSYDFYLIRDVDSRLCGRERAATDEWIHTTLPYHIMRDHPYHGVPVLAGLWGATSAVRKECERALPVVPSDDFYKTVNTYTGVHMYSDNSFYQVDQWWLRLKLYPLMRNKMCSHSEMTSAFEPRSTRRKFPTPRQTNEFVGKGWTEFEEERHPEHSLLVNLPG